MFLGQGLTWMLTTLTLALLPRYLGPGDMGALGIGLSFSQLAATLAGLGMATLITREAARDREATAALLGTAVWLNIALGAVAAAAAIAIGTHLGYGANARLAIVMYSFTIPLNLLILLGFSALQGIEVMRHQALYDAANKLCFLIALGVIVVLDLGLKAYLAVSLFSALFLAVPGMVFMHRYLPFRVLSFSPKVAASLVVRSLPFCTVGIVLMVYLALDVLLLSLISGEVAVGIYSAPARIFGTLLFAPTIITTVVFPRMAALHHNEPSELGQVARTTLLVVIGVTLPVAVLTGTSGQGLLATLIGSDYADSGPVLAVLAVALVPTSINMVAHRILIAADRQRVWTAVIAGALVMKLLLDLALIPLCASLFDNAALGAAAAIVVVESAMTFVAFRLMPRGIAGATMAWTVGRLFAAATIAIGVMYVFNDRPFVVSGAAGATAYAATALGLRAYTVSEIRRSLSWVCGSSPPAPVFTAPAFPRSDHALLWEPGRMKDVRQANWRR